MNQLEIFGTLRDIYANLLVDFVQFLPLLLGAVGVLLVGFLAAHLLRITIRRLVTDIDRVLPAQLSRGIIQRLGDRKSFADLMSRMVFWLMIFISLTIATEVVNLKILSTWLSGLTTYLPRLLAAVLVGFVGIGAGKIIREMVSSFSQSVGIGQPRVLGRTAQVVILVVTVIIVVGQIGIQIGFLTDFAMILAASLLGGAALAFGFGARTLVANILAAHYLRQQYQLGQTVRIAGNEGRIVEIMSTAVILQAKEGRVMVPAKEFAEVASVLLEKKRKT